MVQHNYILTLIQPNIFECVDLYNQTNYTTKQTYSHLISVRDATPPVIVYFFEEELRTCWTILILIYICQDASAFSFLFSILFAPFFSAASRDSQKKTIRWKVNPSTMLGVGVLSLTNRERLKKAHTQELCSLAPETI